MRKLWVILAVCAVAGCGDFRPFPAMRVTTPKDCPLEVKTINNPDEAQIKALEVRVNQLETWATKHGGRMK